MVCGHIEVKRSLTNIAYQVERSRLDGSDHRVVARVGLAEGVAVDSSAGNVFWVDSRNKRIEVARLDGSSRKVTIH